MSSRSGVKSRDEDKKDARRLAGTGAAGPGRSSSPSIRRRGQIKAMVGGFSFRRASSTGRPRRSARPARPSSRSFTRRPSRTASRPASRIVDEPTDFEDKWSGDDLVPQEFRPEIQRHGHPAPRPRGFPQRRHGQDPGPHLAPGRRRLLQEVRHHLDALPLSIARPGHVRSQPASRWSRPTRSSRTRESGSSRISSPASKTGKGTSWRSTPSRSEEVISPQTAYLMTYLLQGVIERGTGAAAGDLLNDRPGREDRHDGQIYGRLVHRLFPVAVRRRLGRQ